jgi:hypothetical protein
MKTAFAAAAMIAGPMNPPKEQPSRAPMASDEQARVRAFHSDVMVATGGRLDFELLPVQSVDNEPFVMSRGVRDADRPMGLGSGWMMVRDASENAVIILIDKETSLRDLEEALDDATDLEAEFSIGHDASGAHLVGVFDTMGQDAFSGEAPVVYMPVPSVMTGAEARFFRRAAVVFPTALFDVAEKEGWGLDPKGQLSSRLGDGLVLEKDDQDELEDAVFEDDGLGWFEFIELGKPILTPMGWLIPTRGTESQVLPEMSYAYGNIWGQRSVEWCVPAPTGGWDYVDGTLADAKEVFTGLRAYGIR